MPLSMIAPSFQIRDSSCFSSFQCLQGQPLEIWNPNPPPPKKKKKATISPRFSRLHPTLHPHFHPNDSSVYKAPQLLKPNKATRQLFHWSILQLHIQDQGTTHHASGNLRKWSFPCFWGSKVAYFRRSQKHGGGPNDCLEVACSQII